MAASRGGAAPAPPALPRIWRISAVISSRGQSPTPEPPEAAKARFARPSEHTLAAPGEPAVAEKVPDRGDDLPAALLVS
jgi:hypothetical protein